MEYNLPYPNIYNRSRLYHNFLYRGEVLAFRTWEHNKSRTGVIVMDSKQGMLVAVNLYKEEGRVWVMDTIPDDIELYMANEHETLWGYQYFFEFMYDDDSCKGKNPYVAFIDNECPHDSSDYERSFFCKDFLSKVPKMLDVKEWPELKRSLWYEIRQSGGLQYDRFKTEFYCFLIGIIMLCEKYSGYYNLDSIISKYNREWDQFSWMYGIAIGRVTGCALKNITSVVKQAGQGNRKHYLHLYLPLVENNLEKILSYNNDKPTKLVDAIRDMRKVEAVEVQKNDLDDMYQVLFPKNFLYALSSSRPAATIENLRQQVASKDEQIKTLESKLSASVSEYKNKYEALLHDFEDLARASLKFDALEANLKKLSRSTAEQIIADMMLTFDEDERILKALKKIKKAVRENDRPTYQHTNVYENGAVHEDKSTHLHIENNNDNQLKLENK